MILAVSLHAKHAAEPRLSTEVYIDRAKPNRRLRWERVSYRDHRLMVPPPDTWTPDTVRAVFEGLRRFLPAHEPSEAMAQVQLTGTRGHLRPPHTRLTVRVGHLESTAWVPSLRPEPSSDLAAFERPDDSLWLNEAMVTFLRETQARGWLSLAALAPVDAMIAPASGREEPPPSVAQLLSGLRRVVSGTAQQVPPAYRRQFLDAMTEALNDKREDEDD